jgi:hypothetical protein
MQRKDNGSDTNAICARKYWLFSYVASGEQPFASPIPKIKSSAPEIRN